ncbi:HAD family phosphatase [Shewanella sp. GutDb-MelDb]|uniref:HAD family hydrolase n=1 Tax=Shewanella sp. GutDb-MelDb TaxID=2058316 RepID=UPI000C7CE0E3|nr:HAD family hydrolase [Shewanella sp. GutDb-MelDb]PKG58693.1 haloacid dehalogenase [Shewanella sp. GutDb-MelDb]
MKLQSLSLVVMLALSSAPALAMSCQSSDSALKSWSQSERRTAIETFVKEVTDPKSPQYVAVKDRIAVFDNDGTLWSEKPMYYQLVFTIEQIKGQAKNNPEWKTKTPFKWVLEDDLESLMKADHHALLELLQATHTGVTVEAFQQIVNTWVTKSKDQRFNRAYIDLTYQPMKEMLDYLKENGFTNYIVSGGGTDFMRAWTEQAYGIPAENVIGSSFGYDVVKIDGDTLLVKNGTLVSNNDKQVKVENIQRIIGKKPILAVGNSDGDHAMLQWSTSQNSPSMAMIVHHTDSEREWQYDRDSSVGRLDKALDEAKQKSNWHLIDMKNDWCTVYGAEK